jgi:hypothetical protein
MNIPTVPSATTTLNFESYSTARVVQADFNATSKYNQRPYIEIKCIGHPTDSLELAHIICSQFLSPFGPWAFESIEFHINAEWDRDKALDSEMWICAVSASTKAQAASVKA